ncbi:MAG: GNAT family N-acetyltransferase [Armatimonadota bacterium]
MFTVRPYAQADYEDFVRIDTATQSRAFWSEADWHPVHPPCDDRPEARRYVVVHTESSRIVGYGAALLTEQSNLDIMVDPAWQRRGVGRVLWEQMERDLFEIGTVTVVTVGPWVRAENTAACRFLLALGFQHVNGEGPVQLSVAGADLSPLSSVAAHLADQGILITTLAAEQEKTQDFESCLRKYYALFGEVEKDVPGRTQATPTSYEQCMEELEQPGMQKESVFIAIHNGEYVGLSILGRRVAEQDVRFGGPSSLSQHLTGVGQDYRRRGIALALKLRTIKYAREHGFERILTNSDNPAMRALNQRLGFRAGPWLIFNKLVEANHNQS